MMIGIGTPISQSRIPRPMFNSSVHFMGIELDPTAQVPDYFAWNFISHFRFFRRAEVRPSSIEGLLAGREPHVEHH